MTHSRMNDKMCNLEGKKDKVCEFCFVFLNNDVKLKDEVCKEIWLKLYWKCTGDLLLHCKSLDTKMTSLSLSLISQVT